MSKYTELMLMYSDNELEVEKAIQVEQLISSDRELKIEYILNHHIDTEMRNSILLNQSKSEAKLSDIDILTKSFIADHVLDNENHNESISFYLNGALSHNTAMETEIDLAEREIYLKGISTQVTEWVESSEEERLQGKEWDEYTLKIAEFVKSGMGGLNEKPEVLPRISIPLHRKLVFRLSSIAAVLIIALGLWSVFNVKSKPEQLFADYYKPYEVIDGQTRSVENRVDDKFLQGVKLYKNGKFAEAGLIFDEMLNADESSPKIRLLYGISLLEEQKYDQAIFNFTRIIDQNGEYLIESKWYLAMCYLGTGDKKSAEKILTELSKVPGLYQEKSAELLKEL